jgi:hypothetical protein
MPHNPIAFGKPESKDQLEALAQKLHRKLATRPLLRAALGAKLTKCIDEIGKLPDPPASPGQKPSFDNFVSPALVQQNKEASSAYFGAVGFYALGEAEGVGPGLLAKLEQNVVSKKTIMENLNQAQDQGAIAYDGALKTWENKQKDHPRLKEDYQKEFARLRTALYQLIKVFNDRRRYDDDLEEGDVPDFRQHYENYVPTHSFFNNAAGGTLYYDFRNNRFQLHIHCEKNAIKANSKALRIKRYGQQHGDQSPGNWGLVEFYFTHYSPKWESYPQAVHYA